MSSRTTASRLNGDSRPVPLNTGTRQFVAPDTLRVRTAAVYSAAGSTVDFTIGGVSFRAKSNQSTGVVPAGGTVIYKFGGDVIVPQGSVVQATSTDANALVTIDFMAA